MSATLTPPPTLQAPHNRPLPAPAPGLRASAARPDRATLLLAILVFAALTVAVANGWGAATAGLCAAAPTLPCGP